MDDKTKARIKQLETAASAMRCAAKSRNIHERLAAVELEAEFVERIQRLRAGLREPELPMGNGTEG